MKKEKIKEDADYLKPRLNPQQIANIKKVFMKKKASDITPSVKAMIKKMDIPTQLAIKQADLFFKALIIFLERFFVPKVAYLVHFMSSPPATATI